MKTTVEITPENSLLISKFMENNYNSLELDFNYLIEIVDKIEHLDLKEYHYKWPKYENELECSYNFDYIEVDISFNKCYIWINLSLDPAILINETSNKVRYDNKIDALYNAIVEFIEYYNALIG
jgi:hypothetical protein